MSPILQYIKENKKDAILWQAARWLEEAGTDAYARSVTIGRIADLITMLPNAMFTESYVDMIATHPLTKAYKVSKKALTQAVNHQADVREAAEPASRKEGMKIPKFLDKEELELKGFCAVDKEEKVGYWGWSQNGIVELTNFLIYPIFHVRGDAETSRHIFEVKNRVKRVLMDVPSKVFVSLETLQNNLVAEGNFIFFGTKGNLLRISNEMLPSFPECYEVKQLGWQPEGFFAWCNHVYKPEQGFVDVSQWGIANVSETSYLIPAASKAYANRRAGEDPFKMVRPLHYKKGEVAFAHWVSQMKKVYGPRGVIGAAYVFVALFRDIVFKINHNCPHLYGYGERSSGKSTWAASLCAIFFNSREVFNLNSGTDFAFFAYMQSFRNCPAQLNEFDDKTVRDEWFQAIKGVFDGEGRMRGKMGSRSAIEVQQVDSALILTGQYISTKDDNSVVSRSIVVPFSESDITEATKKEYTILDTMQKEGLTHIVGELLPHRKYVEDNYYKVFNTIIGNWRNKTPGQFNQRIFNNWCHLASLWYLMGKQLPLPVGMEDFEELVYDEAVKYSAFIRSADVLSEFWNTVAFLLDQGQIFSGWDFRIVVASTVKLRGGDGQEYTKDLGGPRKLLYIRLGNVVPLYQQAYRSRNGEKAMTLQNLQFYFSNREYYVGMVKQLQFKRIVFQQTEKQKEEQPFPGANMGPATTISSGHEVQMQTTSAFVFDYELLGCALERTNPAEEGPAAET